ncbi:MAG: ComF family protein [Clostridia bacterium]|nr:ComF family protein [Clostridia bacterium]
MILSKLTDIFLPPRCAGCDCITESDFPVCSECSKLLIRPATKKNRCDICFLPLDKCICSKRQFYDKFSASFFYDGAVKNTIFKLKFRARPDIAKSFARLICFSLEERDMLTEIDAVTYIPMSRYSQFKRGYNQSKLLAQHISRLSGKPCIGYLTKYSVSRSQHSLDRISRTGNLLGMFEPDPKYAETIKGKTILIVDDVSTTGSTFNEIAKTLLIFGAEAVYAASCTVTKKSKLIIEQNK